MYRTSTLASKTTSTSGIAFVSPYSIPASNHTKLLSLLSHLESPSNERSESLHLNVNVPVPVQFDASEIIDLNNTKILTQSAELQSHGKNKLPSNQLKDTVNVNDEPELYLDIKTIQPTNLQEQLCIVVLNNFPNLKNIAVEKVLLHLMELGLEDRIEGQQDGKEIEDKARKFAWSLVNYEFIDLKTIFIRFNHVKDVKWFVKTFHDIDAILPKVELIYSAQIDEYLKDLEVLPIVSVTDRLKNQIKLILYNSKNLAKPKIKGFEDLDRAMQSYSDYKVDNNDLIDVPNNMKDSIIREIIRFRTKMLSIEKENRQKQIEIEREKTKQKLNKLFEGIKEASDAQQEQQREQEQGQEHGEKQKEKFATARTNNQAAETFVIPEEHEELDDKEYDAYVKAQRIAKQNKDYNQRLNAFKAKEEAERTRLELEIKRLQDYEVNVWDNKAATIAKFRNYESNGLANLYEMNYNEYLKQRVAKRTLEEELDRADIEKETQELENEVQPIKHTLDTYESKHAEPEAKRAKFNVDQNEADIEVPMSPLEKDKRVIIVKELSLAKQNQIKTKIDDLVEDCLGVKDELLLDVIFQSLESSNFDGRDALVTELEEVLDEDAVKLVDLLYDFVRSLA